MIFKLRVCDLGTNLIGQIIHSFQQKVFALELVKEVELIDSNQNGKLCFLEKMQMLVLLNRKNRSLIILSQAANIVKTLNFENIFKDPVAICTNNIDKIFIADYKSKMLYEFNFNFHSTRCFTNCNSIGKFSYMKTSSESIYIADWNKNLVSVINSDNGKLLTSFEIDSPAEIELKESYIFVNSTNLTILDTKTKELAKLSIKSNCVYIIDKITFITVRKVKLDDWVSPIGLFIDANLNIYTTARTIKNNKISQEIKLNKFNINGELIDTFNIGENNVSFDVLITNYKIYFLQYQKILKIYTYTLKLVSNV